MIGERLCLYDSSILVFKIGPHEIQAALELYSPGCSRTPGDPLALAARILGLQVCTTTHSSDLFLYSIKHSVQLVHILEDILPLYSNL